MYKIGHAGAVRRHVASMCHKSCEPRSILGQVDCGSMSYIEQEKVLPKPNFKNLFEANFSTENDRNYHRMRFDFQ